MQTLFEQLRARLSTRPAGRIELPGLSLRESAVLVPIFLREGKLHGLFTKRPLTLRTHAGQIAFPGGTRERDDDSLLHTALRETYEEVGIPSDRVEVLGMLDELPTITQFRIVPFVGVIPPDLTYSPSPEEIDCLLEIPFAPLFSNALWRTEQKTFMGKQYTIHAFDFEEHVVWGATAHIVRSLLDEIAALPSFSR